MELRRRLDLSMFDRKLMDGLLFCRRVYGLIRKIQSEPGGIGRLRLQSTKTEKRLIEELIPLARYVQRRYREGLRIKVRWFAGSQPFDAILSCSGGFVARQRWPKEVYVEITSAVRENDHFARKYLHETGGSFASKGTNRNSETGAIESKPHVYLGGERVDDFVAETIARIRAKCQKRYPKDTVLIIRCVPDGMLLEDEWNSGIQRIVDAGMDIQFREVFLIEPLMNFSATLYGDR